MSEVVDKAQAILDEKNEKIIPTNIKKDVQIFDITGALTSDVKIFHTEDDMQNDSNKAEGNLALLLKYIYTDVNATDVVSNLKFIENVEVLRDIIDTSSERSDIYNEDNEEIGYVSVDGNGLKVQLNGNRIVEYEIVRYNDPYTILHRTTSMDYLDLDYNIHFDASTFSNLFNYFMQKRTDNTTFDGIYKCVDEDNNLIYTLNTYQLDATKENVAKDKIFYGLNGVETGTYTPQIKSYSTVQELYADTSGVENSLGVVIGTDYKNSTFEDRFSKVKYPETVIIPKSVYDEFSSERYQAQARSSETGETISAIFDGYQFTIEDYIIENNIYYTNTEATDEYYTFTKDNGTEYVDYGTILQFDDIQEYATIFGYFMQIPYETLDGFYRYNTYNTFRTHPISKINFRELPDIVFNMSSILMLRERLINYYNNNGIEVNKEDSKILVSYDSTHGKIYTYYTNITNADNTHTLTYGYGNYLSCNDVLYVSLKTPTDGSTYTYERVEYDVGTENITVHTIDSSDLVDALIYSTTYKCVEMTGDSILPKFEFTNDLEDIQRDMTIFVYSNLTSHHISEQWAQIYYLNDMGWFPYSFQLDADFNDVANGKVFMGKNGVETGVSENVGPIKQYATQEEMQLDVPNVSDGQLAIVYNKTEHWIEENEEFTKIRVPTTFTLDETVGSSNIWFQYDNFDTAGYNSNTFGVSLQPYDNYWIADFSSQGAEPRLDTVRYTSEDGLTFTGPGIEMNYKYPMKTNNWVPQIGNILKVVNSDFEGFFIKETKSESNMYSMYKFTTWPNYEDELFDNTEIADIYSNIRYAGSTTMNSCLSLYMDGYMYVVANNGVIPTITYNNDDTITIDSYTDVFKINMSMGDYEQLSNFDLDITDYWLVPYGQDYSNYNNMDYIINGYDGDTVTLVQQTPVVTKFRYVDTQLTKPQVYSLLDDVVAYGDRGVVTGDGSIFGKLDYQTYLNRLLGIKQDNISVSDTGIYIYGVTKTTSNQYYITTEENVDNNTILALQKDNSGTFICQESSLKSKASYPQGGTSFSYSSFKYLGEYNGKYYYIYVPYNKQWYIAEVDITNGTTTCTSRTFTTGSYVDLSNITYFMVGNMIYMLAYGRTKTSYSSTTQCNVIVSGIDVTDYSSSLVYTSSLISVIESSTHYKTVSFVGYYNNYLYYCYKDQGSSYSSQSVVPVFYKCQLNNTNTDTLVYTGPDETKYSYGVNAKQLGNSGIVVMWGVASNTDLIFDMSTETGTVLQNHRQGYNSAYSLHSYEMLSNDVKCGTKWPLYMATGYVNGQTTWALVCYNETTSTLEFVTDSSYTNLYNFTNNHWLYTDSDYIYFKTNYRKWIIMLDKNTFEIVNKFEDNMTLYTNGPAYTFYTSYDYISEKQTVNYTCFGTNNSNRTCGELNFETYRLADTQNGIFDAYKDDIYLVVSVHDGTYKYLCVVNK